MRKGEKEETEKEIKLFSMNSVKCNSCQVSSYKICFGLVSCLEYWLYFFYLGSLVSNILCPLPAISPFSLEGNFDVILYVMSVDIQV